MLSYRKDGISVVSDYYDDYERELTDDELEEIEALNSEEWLEQMPDTEYEKYVQYAQH